MGLDNVPLDRELEKMFTCRDGPSGVKAEINRQHTNVGHQRKRHRKKNIQCRDANRTPCTRGAPAGGFVVTSVTGENIECHNSTVWNIVRLRVKYEKERDECLKAARAGYEVLLAVRKIKESDDFAREMFDGRQARERDRVGPAVDEHYRQMGREFLHYKLWVRAQTGVSWQNKIFPIPQAVGRQLELMSGRRPGVGIHGTQLQLRELWIGSIRSLRLDPTGGRHFISLVVMVSQLLRAHVAAVQPPGSPSSGLNTIPMWSLCSMMSTGYLGNELLLLRGQQGALRRRHCSTSLSPAQSAPVIVRSSANSSSPPPLLRAESASLPLRTASLPLRSASLPAPFVSSSVPSAVVVKREGQDGGGGGISGCTKHGQIFFRARY